LSKTFDREQRIAAAFFLLKLISILTDWNTPNPETGKERVYFVSGGELEKLVVNVLMVVYVP
jgi:hypothetical protein